VAEVIAKAPWWALPGTLVSIVALFSLFVGFGMKMQKHRDDVVTHSQLREKMAVCRTDQNTDNGKIVERIEALVVDREHEEKERTKIWELVRATSQTTAVIQTDVGWIKQTVLEIRTRSLGEGTG